MTDYREIRCELNGATATVTLARPEALNAITPTMLAELNDAFAGLAAMRELTVVVLTVAILQTAVVPVMVGDVSIKRPPTAEPTAILKGAP